MKINNSIELFYVKCSLHFDEKVFYDINMSCVHRELPTKSKDVEKLMQLKNVHEEKKPYSKPEHKCSACDFSTAHKARLKTHIDNVRYAAH